MKRLAVKLVVSLMGAAILTSCGGANNAVNTIDIPAAPDNALAQLQALPTPEGVNPSVFQQLKDELARQLEQSGWKSASKPPDPTKPANVIGDLTLGLAGSDWQLTWGFHSVGDYDQNGAVAIADITPLAVHFGHAVGTDPLDEIIDGDGNGAVGISDITPLAQNFGVSVAGYTVEEMLNGSPDWSPLDSVEVNTGAGDGRKLFTYTIAAPADLSSYRVRPYDNATPSVYGGESNAVRFAAYSLSVELVTASTPPAGGTGIELDPYVVLYDSETPVGYHIRVFYAKGEAGEADVTDQVVFDTYPPAFISFAEAVPPGPAVMTVDNPMAGSFNISAIWGGLAPLTTEPLYFRVQGGLPG